MPRTRRGSAVTPASATARQHPLPATSNDFSIDSLAGPQPPKHRTVASNAQAIDSMGLQLLNMSQLLEKISGKIGVDSSDDSHQHPQPTPHVSYAPEPVPMATPAMVAPLAPLHPPGAPAHPNVNLSHVNPSCHTAAHPNMASPAHAYDNMFNQNSMFPLPATSSAHQPRRQQFDPLGSVRAQTPFRELPTSLQDLEDIPGLQDGVAHLLSTTLAPLSNITGKKLYAHSFVKRGTRRARTTLGDLSLAEYNTGFIKLLNSNNVSPVDRPFMFTHLSHINEDASTYEWDDVRYWSEEVCALVAEGNMSWDDRYNIDLMRLKFSQKNRKPREGVDATPRDRVGGDQFSIEMTAEVRAAKPAPPCRAFNSGSCTSKTHHVSNGFRHLHICAFCMYHKCAPLPHPEKECCSKQFKKRHPKDSESGFGK